MERAWILVGMMGSGKSTVGRLLAERAERTFVDTDQLISQRLGRPIHQLFSIYGQEAFRDHETAVLRSLEARNVVISTGGGIVLRPANWVEMRRLGKIAFLDLPLEVLIDRLQRSARRRPLLETENWQERLADIYSERRPLYERADVVVRLAGEDHAMAVEKLMEALVALG
jgi:shikimate kinase